MTARPCSRTAAPNGPTDTLTSSDRVPVDSAPPKPADAPAPETTSESPALQGALVARREESLGVGPKQIILWIVTGILIIGGIAVLQGGLPLPWTDANQAVPLEAAVPQSGAIPQIGEPAPDFQLMDLNGNPVRLSDFEGRPVVINFWATWCPPCRAEMPDIQAVHSEYGDRAVILAVNIMEHPQTVNDYFQRVGLDFTALLDTGGEVTGRYRIVAVPTTYFIAADGTVADRNVGPMTKSLIESKLQKVLQ